MRETYSRKNCKQTHHRIYPIMMNYKYIIIVIIVVIINIIIIIVVVVVVLFASISVVKILPFSFQTKHQRAELSYLVDRPRRVNR